MKRPSPVLSRRAQASAAPNAARGWAIDRRGGLFLAGMVWLLIAYNVIPPAYYSGHKLNLAEMSAPNPVARAIKLALLAAGGIIVIWRARLAWLVMKEINPFFLIFLGLIPTSVLWSIEPSATMNRFVSVLSMVMVCFSFTLVSWHARRFQNVVRPLLTLILLGSIVFAILAPDLAIEVGEGTLKNAWKGLTSQKNEFGDLASFSVVLWLHAYLSKESQPWRALIFAGMSGACVLLSRSSTSLLATVLTAVFMLMLLRSPSNVRRYMPYIVGTFSTIVVVYAVAVLKVVPGLDILLTPVTSFTGKDLTFSNRSEIWVIIKEHIALSPYIGSGYGAYWIGPVPTSPSYTFFSRMYFYPGESHNGYLEIVNDLGFMGLMVLLGYLVVFVRQSLQVTRIDRNQGALYLSIFFQQAVLNLSGSAWLQINAAFIFGFVTLAMFSISRSLLEYRLEVVFGRRGTRPSA